jgi:zinc transport system ATP-binding protein
MVALVGPNGGGKTTLLRLILGLERPDTGDVRVFGQAPARGRERIAYVPQHARYDTHFPVDVMDVVLMGRLGRKPTLRYSKEDRAAAAAALGDVGLDGAEHRPFADLSGGQRQRVLIARAIAGNPELLLMDEPTANIDTPTQDKLYQLLKEFNQRMAIVLVSHDIGVVPQILTTIICVNRTVATHDSAELTGDVINEMYGTGHLHMVHHDH